MNYQLVYLGSYYAEELVGNDFADEGPVFATLEEAEMYCQECEDAWPEGSKMRDDYDIIETGKPVTARMSVERVFRLVGQTQACGMGSGINWAYGPKEKDKGEMEHNKWQGFLVREDGSYIFSIDGEIKTIYPDQMSSG